MAAAHRLDKSPRAVEAMRAWFEETDTLLIDCDGVIWRGATGIPGVKEAVEALRAAGKRLIFVTNNSTKSRLDYTHKIESTCGFTTRVEDIFGSAYAAAAYLSDEGFRGKAYVIGESGLIAELNALGIEVIGPEDSTRPFSFTEFSRADVDPDVGAVVVGFDGKLSYRKLAVAASCVRYNPGCRFVATNADKTYPSTDMIVPGSGCLVAAMVAGVGREPEMIAGKPSAHLLSLIEKHAGIDRRRACMVGDRLDTDILFGNRNGLHSTLLVMTGVTTDAELDALPADDPHIPTFVLDSFADFLHYARIVAEEKIASRGADAPEVQGGGAAAGAAEGRSD